MKLTKIIEEGLLKCASEVLQADTYTPLPRLLEAKAESDRYNYGKKTEILRELLQQYPDDFIVDSEDSGISGLTHVPTNFRIHMPTGDMHSKKEGSFVTSKQIGFMMGKEAQAKRSKPKWYNYLPIPGVWKPKEIAAYNLVHNPRRVSTSEPVRFNDVYKLHHSGRVVKK